MGHIFKKDKTLLGLFVILFSMSIGIFVSISPKSALIFFAALIIGAIVFVLPMRYIMMTLLLTIFIDLSPITFMGSYVRIYQLVFLMYFAKYLMIVAKESVFPVRFPMFTSLFLWLITFFLAFPHAISPGDFKVVIIGQVFLYLLYFITYNHFSFYTPQEQRKFIKVYLAGGILIALIGIIQYPLVLTGIMHSVHAQVIGIPRPSSLMREPDWYGLLCMYIALFLLTLKLTNIKLFKNTNLWLALSFIGMIISMTRASWVGFAAGLIYLFFKLNIHKKMKVIKIGFVFGFLSIFLFALFYLFSPSTATNILNRINPMTSITTDSGAFDSRMASLEIMKDFISIHPWTGNGVGSMNLISQDESIVSQYIMGDINAGRGNANIIMTSLFDSGIIGTFFLVTFLLSYLIMMLRKYNQTKDEIILAFVVSFIGLLVDFMFNNGIRFGFVWVHLAISLAYAYNFKQTKETA